MVRFLAHTIRSHSKIPGSFWLGDVWINGTYIEGESNYCSADLLYLASVIAVINYALLSVALGAYCCALCACCAKLCIGFVE